MYLNEHYSSLSNFAHLPLQAKLLELQDLVMRLVGERNEWYSRYLATITDFSAIANPNPLPGGEEAREDPSAQSRMELNRPGTYISTYYLATSTCNSINIVIDLFYGIFPWCERSKVDHTCILFCMSVMVIFHESADYKLCM